MGGDLAFPPAGWYELTTDCGVGVLKNLNHDLTQHHSYSHSSYRRWWGFEEGVSGQQRRPGVSPGGTFSISGCSGLIRMQAAQWFGLISTNCGTTSLQA